MATNDVDNYSSGSGTSREKKKTKKECSSRGIERVWTRTAFSSVLAKLGPRDWTSYYVRTQTSGTTFVQM